MVLYPPIIEGTLPPFYIDKTQTSNRNITLTIPYQLGRGSYLPPDGGGLQIMIKTVPLDNYVTTLEITYDKDKKCSGDGTIDFDKKIAIFNFANNSKLYIGEYYKIQMAICDQSGNPGYFSTPSLVKFTTLPQLTLEEKLGRNITMKFYLITLIAIIQKNLFIKVTP